MGLLDKVESAVGEETFKKYADKLGGEEKLEGYVEKAEQNETVKKYANQYGVGSLLSSDEKKESSDNKDEEKK